MLAALGKLAEMTGGRAAVSEDIGQALNLVNETSRVGYLLGYYPSDDRWDGRYRQISVKVKRPGAKALFRHGYYARDTLRPYDREEFLAYSRISAAGVYEAEVSDVPFKVTTEKAKDAAGQPQVKVDLQIDPEKIGFRMVDDRHMGKLYISIFYADSNGNYLGGQWRTMNLDLLEEGYQRLMRSGIQYSAVIPGQAPSQLLKVIIYDTWSDKVGSKVVKVR
jgi:hypothetical protein